MQLTIAYCIYRAACQRPVGQVGDSNRTARAVLVAGESQLARLRRALGAVVVQARAVNELGDTPPARTG